MGLQERVSNIKLIIKNDRRVWFLCAFFLLLLLLWQMSDRRPTYRPQPGMTPTTPREPSTLGSRDSTKDLINTYGASIQGLQDDFRSQHDQLQRTIADQTRDRQQMHGVIESVVDRITQIDQSIARLDEKINNLNLNPSLDNNRGNNYANDAMIGPEVFGDLNSVQGPPPLPPRPLKMTVISPGDSVAVKLLTGVNAPVDGTPYPVLFMINSPITGPDGSSLDVGEARIVAAATGSETDSRALFRLQDLAIRHKDGRRSVVRVEGWIVGEDGIRGMKGTLIDKLGRLIAATAGVSGVSALGEGIMASVNRPRSSYSDEYGNSGIYIGSGTMSYAGAKAITDASNRLGQVLIDRYEKLVPVVEVLSGREVAAVFSQPAEVEIFDESDESIYND